MDERPAFLRGPDRGRWLMVAMLILAGLGLYFWYAPTSSPPAPPAAETE